MSLLLDASASERQKQQIDALIQVVVDKIDKQVKVLVHSLAQSKKPMGVVVNDVADKENKASISSIKRTDRHINKIIDRST